LTINNVRAKIAASDTKTKNGADPMTRKHVSSWSSRLMMFFLLAWAVPPAIAQKLAGDLAGMWSDPPHTSIGEFCFAWCTDAGVERLNKLLDDPANDARPFAQLSAEAGKYQRETYLRPRFTERGLKTFPLDPADDPSFLRCEPPGIARQMFTRHQFQIREISKDRLELRYGEWDARRTIYMDGQKRPGNQPATPLGYSVGHWEGDTLVIETSGITPNILFAPDVTYHSDQLRIVERYTRAKDGKTLALTATIEDPLTLKQPVVLKKIWGWHPESRIAPYKDCQRPAEFSRGVGQP
jgi:hypothetical protein